MCGGVLIVEGWPLLVLQGFVEVEGVGGREAFVHDGADGLDHGGGGVGLEHVASHVHPGGALVDRVEGQFQGLDLRQLLPAGDDDRDRAGGGDLLEAVADVGLDDVGTVLRAHAGGQGEVLGVSDHVLADGGHAHHRDAVPLAGVDRVKEVGHGRGLGGWVTGGDHDRERRGVESDGVVDVEEGVVVQLGQDGRAGVGTKADRLAEGGRQAGADDPPGGHEAVGVLGDRDDAQVDALQARGRAHDEAVVEGEHHGPAGVWAEDP